MQCRLTQFTPPGLWFLPCLLFSLFTLPESLSGQSMTLSRQYVFKDIGRRFTNAFLEDHLGFVWIGGSSLLRYDGYRISKYEMVDPSGKTINSGGVQALLEDHQQRLWVGASNGLYRYDRNSDRFVQYFHEQQEATKFRSGSIRSLYQDRKERIWIGDEEHLYVLENPDDQMIRLIDDVNIGPRYQNLTGITAMAEGPDGEMYAASNKGLWEVQPGRPSIPHWPSAHLNDPENFSILDLAMGPDNDLWLATSEGIWIFDTDQKTFTPFQLPVLIDPVITTLLFDKDQSLWFGTASNGLFQFKEGVFVNFPHDPDNDHTVMSNDIQTLMIDRFQNVWTGTMFGVSRANLKAQKFPFYQIDPGPSNYDNYVYRLMQDDSGGFWFRLLRLGLGYSPGLEETCEILLNPEKKSAIEEIKDFTQDTDGNVWVITLTHGLFKFSPGSRTPEFIDLGDTIKQAAPLRIIADQIDPRFLWISSGQGLCRVNRLNQTAKWFSMEEDLGTQGSRIGHIEQAGNGDLWMTIYYKEGTRLVYFDPVNEKFKAEFDKPGHPSSVTEFRGNRLKKINDRELWVSCNKGTIIINTENRTFESLPSDFPIKDIYSITPDLRGDIWLTGDWNKICKYDGTSCQCYNGQKDIQSFSVNAGVLSKEGRITFGGTNGIYSFFPEEITFESDSVRPQVVLTGFNVLNEKRHLETAYELVKHIELPYEENVFSFEFTSLHFLRTEEITYRYRLLGYQDYWVTVNGDERTAPFTNLDPGDYTFEVVAETADSLVSNAEERLLIQLTITPPWYRTGWAYAAYLTLFGLLLYAFRNYDLRRQIARSEARQLKELDAFKSRFYTNITHEFRTPITLIDGMANQILRQPKGNLISGIALIKRNNQRLSQLVEQLLDLSKLESGSLQLHPIQSDVIPFLRDLSQSFQFYADDKGIELYFQSAPEELIMDYDPDKLLDIISNLLVNAIKFTPEGGTVQIEITTVSQDLAGQVQITIRDTGIGIAEQDLPHIFDRFYQVDSSTTRKGEGAGIGLALSRELVKLMRGQIKVDSKVGQGTTFKVVLPITRLAAVENTIPNRIPKPDLSTKANVQPITPLPQNGHHDLPRLLIVEDTPDVIYYLRQLLADQYQIITAVNGQEGIEQAIASIPDIIISDVMMPEKDGFELCATLKEDPRTSHIPIILLTAKADAEARISGLQRGADAYLAKPFIEAELKVRLLKLIELRARLQARYAASDLDAPQPAPEFEIEDQFIHEIRCIVEAQLDNDNLTITQLAEKLNMSRVQLFRKVKALTGQSPSRLVRSFRLEHAKRMLLNTSFSIAEIAYRVGFSDPAFFSRTFREAYGQSPSEFRQE